MEIKIDPEFQSLIPPLTDKEYRQLEENILADGCRDALVLWGETLIDGHNRYRICTGHGLEYRTVLKEFSSREDAIVWICKNQSGRRNLTQEQMAYLRGRQYEAEKQVQGTNNQYVGKSEKAQKEPFQSTACRIASEHGVGRETIKRDAKFARAVDAIAETAPDIKDQILSGKLRAKKKDIITIADKPKQERETIIERIQRGATTKEAIEAAPEPESPAKPTKVCKRCGRKKPLEDFEEGRNVCYECRAGDARGSKICDIKGRPIEVSEDVKELMNRTGESVYRSITDDTREIHYGIDEFMMEFRAILDTCTRQARDSLEEHPEITGIPENRQKIIAALSEAEAAIKSIKENLINE